jgi:hypothetical protein
MAIMRATKKKAEEMKMKKLTPEQEVKLAMCLLEVKQHQLEETEEREKEMEALHKQLMAERQKE